MLLLKCFSGPQPEISQNHFYVSNNSGAKLGQVSALDPRECSVQAFQEGLELHQSILQVCAKSWAAAFSKGKLAKIPPSVPAPSLMVASYHRAPPGPPPLQNLTLQCD
eukprot:1134611-Pelagomonas_calceolata.AAC.1